MPYTVVDWKDAPKGDWRMEYRHREFDGPDEWAVLHPKHLVVDLEYGIKEISNNVYRRHDEFQYRLKNIVTGEVLPSELFEV